MVNLLFLFPSKNELNCFNLLKLSVYINLTCSILMEEIQHVQLVTMTVIHGPVNYDRMSLHGVGACSKFVPITMKVNT